VEAVGWRGLGGGRRVGGRRRELLEVDDLDGASGREDHAADVMGVVGLLAHGRLAVAGWP
jgi:hypothetical protein